MKDERDTEPGISDRHLMFRCWSRENGPIGRKESRKQGELRQDNQQAMQYSKGIRHNLAPVVQTMDSAIRRINHYPLDNSIDFASVYPLDSDLSGG